jgi:hypothetical protein
VILIAAVAQQLGQRPVADVAFVRWHADHWLGIVVAGAVGVAAVLAIVVFADHRQLRPRGALPATPTTTAPTTARRRATRWDPSPWVVIALLAGELVLVSVVMDDALVSAPSIVVVFLAGASGVVMRSRRRADR